MNIRMAGIDYSLADIDIREVFSFTTSKKAAIYEALAGYEDIFGAVIVSTCNRTELYLSCADGNSIDPFALLCKIANEDYGQYVSYRRQRSGDAVFTYLCQLACGAQSQIWGEDQIITQVKDSITLAREYQATDSLLEVMFRTAITAAKRIKTEVRFSKEGESVATKALALIEQYPRPVHDVLVIGNGEVGRLMAKTLVAAGYNPTMTMRTYRHGAADIPDGVKIIDYSSRYEYLTEYDCVISGTLSPHFTLEKNELVKLAKCPGLLIDLAVPRDIEPTVADIEGITLYDMDAIGRQAMTEKHEQQLRQISVIIEKYRGDFEKWQINREQMAI